MNDCHFAIENKWLKREKNELQKLPYLEQKVRYAAFRLIYYHS